MEVGFYWFYETRVWWGRDGVRRGLLRVGAKEEKILLKTKILFSNQLSQKRLMSQKSTYISFSQNKNS